MKCKEKSLRSATSVEYQLPIRPGRDFSRNRKRQRPKTSRTILCRCQKATRGLKGSINGAEIKSWDNLLVEVDGMKLLFHKTRIHVVPITWGLCQQMHDHPMNMPFLCGHAVCFDRSCRKEWRIFGELNIR